MIEFIDGDPGSPILTGCVYSATEHASVYASRQFHAERHQDAQPDSSGDGGAEEFNELRFEDKQGSEDIYFHAQKTSIGLSRTTTI